MTELKKLPSRFDSLPTKEELKARPRNRTELTIWNGLEFGIGFWLAGVGVLIFGVPILTCAALIVLAVIGDTLSR